MKKRLFLLGIVTLGLLAPQAMGITAFIRLETDQDVYLPGEEVRWTIYIGSDPAADNQGFAGVNLDLDESRGEALAPADAWGAFGPGNGFDFSHAGTPSTEPSLVEISSAQMTMFTAPVYDVANDGQEHVYATGAFVPANLGQHVLTVLTHDDLIYGGWQFNFYTDRNGTIRNLGDSTLGTGDALDVDQADAVFYVTESGVIPEPITAGALASAVAGLAGYLRRRRR